MFIWRWSSCNYKPRVLYLWSEWGTRAKNCNIQRILNQRLFLQRTKAIMERRRERRHWNDGKNYRWFWGSVLRARQEI